MELQMIVGWTERGIAPGSRKVRDHVVVERRAVVLDEVRPEGRIRIESRKGLDNEWMDLDVKVQGGKMRVAVDLADEPAAYDAHTAESYLNLTRPTAKITSFTGMGDRGYGHIRSDHPARLPDSIGQVEHSTRDAVVAMAENPADVVVVSAGEILRTVEDLDVVFTMDGDDVHIADIVKVDEETFEPFLDGEGRFFHRLAPHDFVAMVENGNLQALYMTNSVTVLREGDLAGLRSRNAPHMDAAGLVLGLLGGDRLMAPGDVGRTIRTCAMSAMDVRANGVGDAEALLGVLSTVVNDADFQETFGIRPAEILKEFGGQVQRIRDLIAIAAPMPMI
jgi:hypothetical protein